MCQAIKPLCRWFVFLEGRKCGEKEQNKLAEGEESKMKEGSEKGK